MAEIINIPIEKLHAHPYNPRREVGDVTELAESIRAKGILQNLTVVPMVLVDPDATITLGDDHYTVVIGHRRLAAAALVGLKEVPCSIVEMTEEEMISTMLVENMQRSDLTVYEEAKGIQQLMMNLGKSVKEVSDLTGFSETTVRHRAKLAELDEKKFKKAVDRGATLFDFIEIEAFENPEEKDKLLDVIGTQDFRNTLNSMKTKKRERELLDEWEKQISQWAVKCEGIIYGHPHAKAILNGEEIICDYVRNYGTWNSNKKEPISPPEDVCSTTYYFMVGRAEIDLYRLVDKDTEAKQDAEQAERQRIKDEFDAKKARFHEMENRHRELRREFILNFNAYQKKDKNVFEFLSEALISGFTTPMSYGYQTSTAAQGLAEFLGVTYEEEAREMNYAEFMNLKMNQPERTAVLIAYWIMDRGSFWYDQWNSDLQRYQIKWRDNKTLEKCVKLLTYLGYPESTEEIKMRRGSLEDFDVGSDGE